MSITALGLRYLSCFVPTTRLLRWRYAQFLAGWLYICTSLGDTLPRQCRLPCKIAAARLPSFAAPLHPRLTLPWRSTLAAWPIPSYSASCDKGVLAALWHNTAAGTSTAAAAAAASAAASAAAAATAAVLSAAPACASSRHEKPLEKQQAPGELTGFFPRLDRIFPSSTSKRYSKG